jgi:hypothetical protein
LIQQLRGELETLGNHVIDSYRTLLEHFSQLVHIDLKQNMYNVKEKLVFHEMKFKSFVIEIDNLLQADKYELLKGLVHKINVQLIEFFVSLFDF